MPMWYQWNEGKIQILQQFQQVVFYLVIEALSTDRYFTFFITVSNESCFLDLFICSFFFYFQKNVPFIISAASNMSSGHTTFHVLLLVRQ